MSDVYQLTVARVALPWRNGGGRLSIFLQANTRQTLIAHDGVFVNLWNEPGLLESLPLRLSRSRFGWRTTPEKRG
jgi:hypothetical protein